MQKKQQTSRLSHEDAAHYLGVSENTLYRWVQKRRVAHFRLAGRFTYDIGELDRVIGESEYPRQSAAA